MGEWLNQRFAKPSKPIGCVGSNPARTAKIKVDYMDEEWYTLPPNEYHPVFLKALAIAAHLKIMLPSELTYHFEDGKSQTEIAKIIFSRIKK